jgi:hypothetical protein
MKPMLYISGEGSRLIEKKVQEAKIIIPLFHNQDCSHKPRKARLPSGDEGFLQPSQTKMPFANCHSIEWLTFQSLQFAASSMVGDHDGTVMIPVSQFPRIVHIRSIMID